MLKYPYYKSDEERTAIITYIFHISKDTVRQAVFTVTAFYHKALYMLKFYKNHNYWVQAIANILFCVIMNHN